MGNSSDVKYELFKRNFPGYQNPFNGDQTIRFFVIPILNDVYLQVYNLNFNMII